MKPDSGQITFYGHEVKSATRMRWFRRMRNDAVPILILSMADSKGTLGPDSTEQARNTHLQWCGNTIVDYYTTIKKHLEQQRLISGKDLMTLSVGPGPEMGRILSRVQEGQDTGEIATTEDALALARRIIGF